MCSRAEFWRIAEVRTKCRNSQYIKCIIRSLDLLLDDDWSRCCLSSMHPVNQNILSKTSSVESVFISGGCMRSAKSAREHRRRRPSRNSFHNWRSLRTLGYRGRSSSDRFIWIIAKLFSRARRIYPALNYTDGRARCRGSGAGCLAGLLSSHPILITLSVRGFIYAARQALLHGRLRKSHLALISVLHLRPIFVAAFSNVPCRVSVSLSRVSREKMRSILIRSQ